MNKKDKMIINDRTHFLLDMMYKYKCATIKQLQYLCILIYKKHFSYNTLEVKIHYLQKHGYISNIKLDKSYYYCLKKGLDVLNSDMKVVKPAFSLLKHTEDVLNAVIYCFYTMNDIRIVSERILLREHFNYTRLKGGSLAIPDFIILDLNENREFSGVPVVKFVCEVERTKKSWKDFQYKCSRVVTHFEAKDFEQLHFPDPDYHNHIKPFKGLHVKIMWFIPERSITIKNNITHFSSDKYLYYIEDVNEKIKEIEYLYQDKD